tara:strand:- start:127 stop:318 length:192 start_codon:yes stop_codon:yes gene_type:complete
MIRKKEVIVKEIQDNVVAGLDCSDAAMLAVAEVLTDIRDILLESNKKEDIISDENVVANPYMD